MFKNLHSASALGNTKKLMITYWIATRFQLLQIDDYISHYVHFLVLSMECSTFHISLLECLQHKDPDTNTPKVPFAQTDCLKTCFFHKAIGIWNNLSPEAVASSDLQSFKHSIKPFFLWYHYCIVRCTIIS